MKFMRYFILAALLAASGLQADAKPLDGKKFAIINFKTCIEKSKLGKQEAVAFEKMKKQMETVLQEKEKTINEIAGKFNDPDYIDSLTAEAEAELKHKFRTLGQELQVQQNQCYQVLSQTNMKVMQKINELVTQVAQKIAKKDGLDAIFNEESAFYYNPTLDRTDKAIAELDILFEQEASKKK